MFSISSILQLLFPALPPSDKEWKAWRQARNKQMVQRYASGNVRLQSGHYTTEAELDARKSAILAYRF